jgi:hypothetical protein
MSMNRDRWDLPRAALAATVALACTTVPLETARACGGLFCSGGGGPTTTTQSNFVNQSAERIVFVDNADGTVTAIIQIVYEGPADRFAWILPVPGVPDVKVSSNLVLDALQAQTNPQYQVTTTQIACPAPPGNNFGGGGCLCGNCSAAAPSAGTGALGNPGSTDQLGGPAVVVEAAGSIGPYDFTVLSVNPLALDPATVAIDWLTQNEFDVGELGPEVLRPYLLDGLNLLAFRLNKQADTGSIRPVMLTYEAENASIPIVPTAVAANEDMGVLVWVAAEARVVPLTYSSVELNEAVIDWFNPGSNYADVVSAAADEAGGRAFVTEFAGTLTLTSPVTTQDWLAFVEPRYADWRTMVSTAFAAWGTWDGFDEALGAAASLPENTALADLTRCLPALADPAIMGLPDCEALLAPTGDRAVSVDMDRFASELHELVITPVIDSFAAIDSQPYLTRLYTTLSPDEMTVDPVFAVNRQLDMVSNQHGTQRTFPCGASVAGMALPQGATIVTNIGSTTWPVQMDQLPAALRVVQYGTSGPGRVLMDASETVVGKTFGLAACRGQFPAVPTAGTGGGAWPPAPGGTLPGGTAGRSGWAVRNDGNTPSAGGESNDGGCRAARHGASSEASIAVMLAALLGVRRRASRSRRAR